MASKMVFQKDIKNSNVCLRKLLKLIKENPELPVFPVVDENIVDSIEFNTIFNLCKFEEPYVMEYCYYKRFSKTEMYTEWSKEAIEYVATKKNQKVEWKKAIFVPISVCER